MHDNPNLKKELLRTIQQLPESVCADDAQRALARCLHAYQRTYRQSASGPAAEQEIRHSLALLERWLELAPTR